MGTINDIGAPGQPLNTPPLTAWQAAVRDAFDGTGRLASVTGSGVTLNTTDQQVAYLDGATAGNPSVYPRLAVCAYSVTFNGSASIEGIFTLEVRNGGNSATLATVSANQALASVAAKLSHVTLVLPYLMAPTTAYIVRVMARTSSGSATLFASSGNHKLHRILI